MKTGQDASVRANIISLPGLHKEKVGDHVLMTCLVVTRMCKRLEGRTYRIDFFPALHSTSQSFQIYTLGSAMMMQMALLLGRL